MNLEQLQAMSDAELNELSAVKVMGFNYRGYCEKIPDYPYVSLDPNGKLVLYTHDDYRKWNPSTDMNDAFEVLQALGKMGILHRIRFSEIISKTFTASTGEIAAWPNAIFLLKPNHITIASILAKEKQS